MGTNKELKNRRPVRSLSTRLLGLTIVFVMLAEILIFAPSVAKFRTDYFEQRLGSAHLALLAIEASRGNIIGAGLQAQLLRQAGALGMTAMREGQPDLTLGPEMPAHINRLYDLRSAMYLELITDALMTLWGTGNDIIAVTGPSPDDPSVMIEVVLEERPLREAMRAYGLNIFLLSLLISGITAALVFFTLQWLMVRPMSRLSANITAFQNAPEDTTRIIRPSGRSDEIGRAEQSLADMQSQLHAALIQKGRLADVGTAVTKISHDLKNILTTAQLESDRLERKADEDTRKMTARLLQSLDRAVQLCTSTLNFAKEGPVKAKPKAVHIGPFLQDVLLPLDVRADGVTAEIKADPNLSFVMDQSLTLRIIDNLVTNAADAGAAHISVTATRVHGGLEIRVSDNGPGLSEKAKANLFKPFEGSTRAGGTGLGLPIALECAKAQGGTLQLENTSASGTTFLLTLPEIG